jgi:hypothetical protein
MRRFAWISLLAGIAFVSALPGSARADLIKYRVEGVGTGELGSMAFTDMAFSIVIVADTGGIQTLNPFVIAVNNLSTTVRVGATTAAGLPGSTYRNTFGYFYYIGDVIGTDFDAPNLQLLNAAFSGFNLASPLGPLSINPSDFRAFLSTNLGFFGVRSANQVRFQAVIVPEPASLTLAAGGGLALLAAARRRRGRSGR